MKYFTFITDPKFRSQLLGSDIYAIKDLEIKLKVVFPEAFIEYLLLFGRTNILYNYCDEHGVDAIVMLKEWLDDWICKYSNSGIDMSSMKNSLPFYKFQDTFFFFIIDDNQDPSIYAFDINDSPTIRLVKNSFTDFVLWRYTEKISSKL